jgi:hypothetical protein
MQVFSVNGDNGKDSVPSLNRARVDRAFTSFLTRKGQLDPLSPP